MGSDRLIQISRPQNYIIIISFIICVKKFRNTHGRDVKMGSHELLWILNNVLKLIRVKLTVYIQYSGEILV